MRPLLPVMLLLCTTAHAHPMGRSEYSLRNAVRVDKSGLHVVVMGEIPMAVVIDKLGERAGDGKPDQALVDAWNQEQWAALGSKSTLQVAGEAVAVAWKPTSGVVNGRAVDGFFVYAIEAKVPASELADSNELSVAVRCDAWSDVPVVFAGKSQARGVWSVVSSDAPDDWTRLDAARALHVTFRRP